MRFPRSDGEKNEGQASGSGEEGKHAGLLKRKLLPQAGCPHLLGSESDVLSLRFLKFGRNGDLALMKIPWCPKSEGRQHLGAESSAIVGVQSGLG